MTAIIIAPLVALCCLGPSLIGSAMGSIVGWLGEQGFVLTTALALLAEAFGYAVMRWRRPRSGGEGSGLTCGCVGSKALQGGELDFVRRADKQGDTHPNATGHRLRTVPNGRTSRRSVEPAGFNREMPGAPEDKRPS